VEEPGKGKSTPGFGQGQIGRHTGGADCRQARYDRLGAGNDGVYLRKPDIPQAWLARGSLDPSGEVSSWLDAGFWTFLKSGLPK